MMTKNNLYYYRLRLISLDDPPKIDYYSDYERRIRIIEERGRQWIKGEHGYFAGSVSTGGGGSVGGAKSEKGLDNSAESGIMKDSADGLIEITKENIVSVSDCNFFSSQELNEKVTEKCKEILSDLQGDIVGTEETVSIKIKSLESEKQKGEQGEGAVKVIEFDEPYVSIHNHPSGETFSGRDIDKFAYDNNHLAMCVVGNNGNIYILQKKSDYNWINFAMKSIDIQQTEDYAKKVLNGAEKYGFEYYKG